MRILITNDDGYTSKGLSSLVKAMREFGDITVVAPKSPQSGMSMAVTMGYRPMAAKHLKSLPGEDWWYLDGTPASCVKFGLDNVLYPDRPDIVVSGVNHGSNAATAAIYSGTVGAASEGAVNGIPSFAVSLDSFDKDADFSAVESMLPGIIRRLMDNYPERFGSFFNINFPDLPEHEIKGIRPSRMGLAHWEREYLPYGPEFLSSRRHEPTPADIAYIEAALPGEEFVVMAGDFVSNPGNGDDADHLLNMAGYVTVTPHNLDNTDSAMLERLCGII